MFLCPPFCLSCPCHHVGNHLTIIWPASTRSSVDVLVEDLVVVRAAAAFLHIIVNPDRSDKAGRRQTARSTLLMYVVHLGRLKTPRKAAGQMDLLTVPSADGVDSKVIQVEEALSASSRDR